MKYNVLHVAADEECQTLKYQLKELKGGETQDTKPHAFASLIITAFHRYNGNHTEVRCNSKLI